MLQPLAPESLEARISDCVRREDLSEQFQAADLVAVVELQDSLAIRGTRRIQRAVLRERLKGNAEAMEFWIDSPRVSLPSQKILLFAVPGSDGQTWRGLKSFGGMRTLQSGVIEGTTRTLDELRRGPE